MNTDHLNEEQLAASVVDEADLPLNIRTHLEECEMCGARKRTLERDLTELGRLASEWAPTAPVKSFRAEEKAVRPDRRLWRYGLPAGAALAAALILALCLAPVSQTPVNLTPVASVEVLDDDSDLLIEAARLSESPFSQFHAVVTGQSAPVISDEFIDFIIPDDEPLSLNSVKGGQAC